MKCTKYAAMLLALGFADIDAAAQAGSGHAVEEAKLLGSQDSAFGREVSLDGNVLVASGKSVCVYEFDGVDWTEATLDMTGVTGADYSFGVALDVSGNTIAISDSLYPFSSHTHSSGPGAVFVFTKSGGSWALQATLTASDGANGDQFGASVAIEGDTIIVGAPGNQAVYFFQRTGSTWLETAMFQPGSGTGSACAIAGKTAIVGGSFSLVRTYAFGATGWLEEDTIQAPLGITQFGEVVALDGNTAAIHAWSVDVPHERVLVYVRNGTSWTLQQQILQPSPLASLFGYSLALSDSQDMLVVGAQGDSTSGASSSGAVYVFMRSGTTWTQEMKVVTPDLASNDALGDSVALANDTMVSGASLDDNQGGTNAGAVSIFKLYPTWFKLGLGLAGSMGVPVLEGSGALTAGSAGGLTLSSARPFAQTILFVSTSNTPTLFKGGTLATVPVAFQLPVFTFLSGEWFLPWSNWPAGVPSGANLYFQVAVSDPASINGVAISNLLRAEQP